MTDSNQDWLEDEDPPSARAETRSMRAHSVTGRAPGRGDSPELETPAFPIVLRGYEREAVDLHLTRLRRRIAELEALRTPENVMRHALEQVGEETSGILRAAQDTAADIAARSRAQADERLERAKRDADEVRVSAEMRLRQLDADTDTVWRERSALVEDVRKLASQLAEVVERAERRYPADEDTGAGGRSGAFESVGQAGPEADHPAHGASAADDLGDAASEGDDRSDGASEAEDPGDGAAGGDPGVEGEAPEPDPPRS